MTPNPAETQGERQVGQYFLERKIGQGGMAEVWKARHKVLGTYVAIKFLIPGFAGVPDIESRFLSEGQRQAKLSHYNIVSAYDFIYENERSYLIMKLIEGESLEDRLFRLQGPMALGEVLSISADVLRALDYAHSQNIIHRDIKPSNILIDHEGRAYVMDFGIALVLGEQRATRVGVAVGTPHFMSPEQIVGARLLDRQTDIYSYGCVLYEMFTGKLPFDAPQGESGTDYVIQNMHLNQTPEPPSQMNPAIPEHIERAVLRCLEKKAEDRFNSCAELLTALTQQPPAHKTIPDLKARPVRKTVVEDQPIEVPRQKTIVQDVIKHEVVKQELPRQQTPQPKNKSWNVVAMISGTLLVLVLLGGGGYWYKYHHPDDGRTDNQGKVSVSCTAECVWQVDGKPQGQMPANQSSLLTLPFGTHVVSASTTDSKQTKDVRFTLSANSGTPSVVVDLPPLQIAGPGPIQKPVVDKEDKDKRDNVATKQPTDLSGNWIGKFTNENTGLTAPFKLAIADRSDLLSGTMTFDPGGKFSSSCSVKGVYEPQKLQMYLEVSRCGGAAPSYLSDKMIFMSVHPTDKDARGVNSTQTALIELSR